MKNLKNLKETHDLGNNHKSFRSRKYVFTYNNYSEDSVENLKIYLNKHYIKWIFGEEIGKECGTPHLQGYMKFTNQKYWNEICNACPDFQKCWSAKAKGKLIDNYDYTSKDGKFHYGGFKPDKIRYKVDIQLYDWQKKICEELQNDPDDRSINWIWEPDGCAGKTTFQKYIYLTFQNVCITSGKSADMKNGIIEFIKKHGETPDIVLINIPRCNIDYVSYEGIESIKDMFFYSGKYEGGQVCGKSPHVYIFANSEPPIDKLSEDRWKVKRIRKFKQ